MRESGIAARIAFGILLFCSFGVAYGTRDFTTLKIGPLYLLEAAWIFWAIFALWDLKAYWKVLSIALPFFLWGILRLVWDLTHLSGADIAIQRVLQHCVFFVYPALWIPAGVWLAARMPRWASQSWMMVALLTTLAANSIGRPSFNFAVGPLTALLAATALAYSEQISARWRIWGCAILLSLCWVPFFLVILEGREVQRLNVALTFLTLAGTYFIFPLSRAQRARWLMIGTLSGMIWLGSALGLSVVQKNRASLGEALGKAVVKGEDRILPGHEVLGVPFRFRSFIWKTATDQWLSAPITGVGMIPEVPSEVRPGVANVGGYEYPGAPPVIGPHNSYLMILARTGLIGALAFLGLLSIWAKRVRWQSVRNASIVERCSDLMILVLPFYGLFYALLNVGLESPHGCFHLWVAIGMGLTNKD